MSDVEIWYSIAKRIRRVNGANGWNAPSWDRLLDKLMLVHTELEEARQSALGISRDPLGEELADCAIRLIDILESIWPGDWALRGGPESPSTPSRWNSIEQILWPVVRDSCAAAESWRMDRRDDARVSIEMALREVRRIATTTDVDLLKEIRAKVEKNSQRGYLHGKVQGAG